MKITCKTTLLLTLLLTAGSLWAESSNGTGTYYRAANGKTGAELKTTLHLIIKDPNVVSYSGLKAAYTKTDVRPDGFLHDWYSNATNYVPGSDFASVKAEGNGYSREHLMPQSWYKRVSPMVSDVMQVVPADSYINSRRNDLPFGEVVSDPSRVNSSMNGYSKWGAPRKDLGAPAEVTSVFEPNDEIKGDIARVYFYMATCYEDRILEWTNNNAPTVIGGDNYQPLQQWVFNLMMRWSEQDPVDSVEAARNDAAYQVQGNRNPFVDYPGLEQYIWGDKQQEPFDYGGPTDETPDEPSVSGTILLNNAFFGVDWNGARPTGGAIQMTGRAGGITVTYAKGDKGQNMYCNDKQIRLYRYNTLTFNVVDNEFVTLYFNVAGNTGNKVLTASTGTVEGYNWTGQTNEVVFMVDEEKGNLQLASVDVALAVSTTIDPIYDWDIAHQTDDAIYDLQGRKVRAGTGPTVRAGTGHAPTVLTSLPPGVYIVKGKKIIIK